MKKSKFSKIKDKFEDFSSRKSNLDSTKEKSEDINDIPIDFEKTSSPSSIIQKYKSPLRALARTKNILQEYDSMDNKQLSTEDLKSLQTDLAQLKTEISEDKKKSSQWQSIKTFSTNKDYKFELNEYYWAVQFKVILKAYLKLNDFKDILEDFHILGKIQCPILVRLYEKVKSTQRENFDIWYIV